MTDLLGINRLALSTADLDGLVKYYTQPLGAALAFERAATPPALTGAPWRCSCSRNPMAPADGTQTVKAIPAQRARATISDVRRWLRPGEETGSVTVTLTDARGPVPVRSVSTSPQPSA